MAVTLSTAGLGIPVAIGQIDRELKLLWDRSDGAETRASLMNLAVYCEGEAAMTSNTGLIAQITEDHACRALLICAEPQAAESSVQAWISAHCHLSRAGAKQICCEQITFLLEGPSRNLIPNIVFSHLDSDLPLLLWWQGEFPDPIDCQLWTWVDRLIFDSSVWRDQCHQLKVLRKSLPEAQGRLTLCDLNWTRTLYFRQALSSLFDHPDTRPFLDQIRRVSISRAPGHRCTALLLVSWLASRLGWTLVAGGEVEFTDRAGQRVTVDLTKQPGAALDQMTICAGEASFRIAREPNSNFLHCEMTLPGGRKLTNLAPTGKDGPADLLSEELALGGRHDLYLQALEVAEQLL